MKNNKSILTGKDVINLEIKALQKLKKNINKSFHDAVIKISKCPSRLKSANCNSLGTTTLYC